MCRGATRVCVCVCLGNVCGGRGLWVICVCVYELKTITLINIKL